MPSKIIDLIGKQYGFLTVIKATEERSNGYVIWECLCRCGNAVNVRSDSLRKDHTKSCGCLKKIVAKNNSEHRRISMRRNSFTGEFSG